MVVAKVGVLAVHPAIPKNEIRNAIATVTKFAGIVSVPTPEDPAKRLVLAVLFVSAVPGVVILNIGPVNPCTSAASRANRSPLVADEDHSPPITGVPGSEIAVRLKQELESMTAFAAPANVLETLT